MISIFYCHVTVLHIYKYYRYFHNIPNREVALTVTISYSDIIKCFLPYKYQSTMLFRLPAEVDGVIPTNDDVIKVT